MPSDQRPFVRIAVWLAASCWLSAGSAAAQGNLPAEPPRVTAVRVVTESGSVLEQDPPQLPIRSGQVFSMEAESASLRELFRTGQYADLRAELMDVPGGVRLDFVVRQNFYINLVHVEGLREPPSESLALSALRLNLGEAFRESDLKEAVDRLRQTLEDEGQYQAKTRYELTPHPDTLQMDILIRVMPGPRARVGAIQVQNQTEFPDEELRDQLNLNPGREITSARLNRSADRVRRWLAKKNFLGARVSLRRGTYDAKSNSVPLEVAVYAGLELRVTVEGAKVSSRTLHKLLPIYQEGAADEDLLQEGRRALRDLFEAEGYFDAQVSYTTSDSTPSPQATSPARRPAARTVTYHVERGGRHRLVGVAFTGNKYFSSSLLSGRLKIEPAGRVSPGRYSSALLQQDADSIRTLYDSNGFHDVMVTSVLDQDYRGKIGDLFVHFEVAEGPQTRIADLVLEGNQALSKDELLRLIGSTPGQPYSDFNISSDRDNLLALYYDQGFPDARFSADVEKLPQAGPNEPLRVKLTYHITEGRQVLVARVLMSGQEHTRPGVISREVGIQAGEPLSEGDVVETQRKLYNLGVFSRVSIAPQNPNGQDPRKTVVVMVEEAKRYTIAYGLGFEAQRLGNTSTPSTTGTFSASPRVTLEVSKANLTGRADTLSFKVRASTIQGRALVAYTAPNYFGSPNFSIQFTGFFDKTRDVQTFNSKRYEGAVQLVERLPSASTILYRYAYRHVIATDLQIAPEQVPLFNQPTEISEFGVSWLRDHRNNPASPSRGDYENIDVSLASKPIGSSANFTRIFLQNSTYHPIGRRMVFARSFRFGIQTPYGNTPSLEIPLPERFFAGGGTTLRGFALNQAGPRDPETGFPVGGQALLVFNQDLRFPMRLPLIGNRLGGALFYDAGNVFPSIRKVTLSTAPPLPVFDPNNPGVCLTNCTNELSYFSHTVGFEFRYGTPIGPISIDLGYQLNPAHFLVPITGCVPNQPCLTKLSRLPGFQFFINLGTTF
jgi:outer membrane protein insertion porin family